jgi:tetratricopeptide (TPR) repeat protein
MGPVLLAFSLAAALAGPLQTPTRESHTVPAIDSAALPGEAGKAIGDAYEAARSHPDNAGLVGGLAVVLHAWEQWDLAAETYRLARRLAPNDRRWWYLAGLLETARGDHSASLPLFERAVALEPRNLAGRLRLAEGLLETGELDATDRILIALSREPSTAAPAEYGLGRVALARGDDRDAVAHFEKAVAAFPDFGAAHYSLALTYRRMGHAAKALESLQRQQMCVPCWPKVDDPVAASVPAAREDAAALLRRGIRLAADGQDQAAIEAHERALALSPTLGQARVNLITLYGRAGNWAAAEKQYGEAIQAGMNIAEAHANYGQVLLAQHRAAEAIPVFRQALAASPADARTRNSLGLALETTGDGDGAAAAYRQAVSDAPTLRIARFNLGRTLVAAGRLEDAVAAFETLRTPEDHETARYVFALSAALVRMGYVERGRAVALAALEMARRYGQSELAATIERDLATLK